MYWGHHYWGMHAFWWIFWMMLVAMFVFVVWRPTQLRGRDGALDVSGARRVPPRPVPRPPERPRRDPDHLAHRLLQIDPEMGVRR
jgi:hypothetical protein